MKCLQCGGETDNPKFCNSRCSALYSNEHRFYKINEDKRTKIVKCVVCGKELEVNIRASDKICKCKTCKSCVLKRRCSICGQVKCLRRNICKSGSGGLLQSLSKYFGFDLTKIGTVEVYREYDRVRDLVVDDYINHQLSTTDLGKKYQHFNNGNLIKILESLDIERRSLRDSTCLAYQQGKISLPTVSIYPYKSGWHTTWNGKKVFLRSSYELDYAKLLDEHKIDYDVESLRICYWNSLLQRQATAVPDFYLTATNEIVEIKSTYTYNEQEMRDKFEAYEQHGYKYKLILEGKPLKL